MVSRAEVCKRQFEHFYKVEGSLAPRKKAVEAPAGIGGRVDERISKARTVISLITGWAEVAEAQEARRRAGLSWAPHERYRDVERAASLLGEIVADMRSET